MAKLESRKYHIIQAAIYYNKITWRNTNLPSNLNKFIELFVGQQINILINIFLEYDQYTLAKDC